jgi:hypothetical protein
LNGNSPTYDLWCRWDDRHKLLCLATFFWDGIL